MNAEADERDRLAFEKYGFLIHYVSQDPDAPNCFNAHTHGLMQSFGHLDFQICLPSSPQTVLILFHDLVRNIKGGAAYEPGKKYPDILGNGYLLEFIKAKECGRDVLRFLIPDKYGKFDAPTFQSQFTMLGHAPQTDFLNATKGGVDLYG